MRKRLRWAVKWIGGGLAGLVALVLLGLAGGWLWLQGSLPRTDGEVLVGSPQAPAEILRDADGLVTIRAESWNDAYFALGYAHAQDRLVQMEMLRRVGTGRLSEVAGAMTLDFDRLMRALDLAGAARRSWRTLGPELRRALEVYAEGVNAYLETHEGPWPPEFLLAGAPERWEPWHSLLWGKLMALRLSGNWREELDNARLIEAVGRDALGDLFPDLAPEAATLSGAGIGRLSSLLEALPREAGLGASNVWAVAGARTASGKPVLANDPHLGLQVPATWYLARLETPEGVLAGATSPGVPLMILGHNGRAAWGFTTTHSDVQDLVVETLDPADPGRYLTPEGSRPFETREETIAVRFGADVTETFRATRHGPVVSDADAAAGAAAGAGRVLALAWPFLRAPDTSPEALYRLNFARTWEEFTAAMRLWTGPQQNIFWANTEGTIGFYAPALVPLREGYDGSLPVDGASRARLWSGTIPFAELPHARDPEAGVLINANNRIAGPAYPYRLATRFEPPYRAQRIAEVLDAERPHTPAASWALQRDRLSLMARELVPLLTAGLPGEGTPSQPSRAGAALALLRDWDFVMAADRPQPLLLYAWLRELNAVIFADELGAEAYAGYAAWNPAGIARALTAAPAWCDNVDTAAVEDCRWARQAGLDRALAWLERLGAEGAPAELAWGDWHVARLQHLLLGRVPLLGQAYRTRFPIGGGNYTVQRATPSWGEETPLRMVHGAGLRAVYDLADLEQSRFVITSGQSGNPFSPHFLDLAPRWRDGGYVKLVGDAQAAGGRLVLRPR